MKKFGKLLLPVIIGLFACVVSVNAQEWKFGVKGGMNFSTISGLSDVAGYSDLDFSTSTRVGLHLGGVVQGTFNKFFLQSELLFSSVGMNVEVYGEEDGLSLNYLQMPVYGGLKLPVAPSIKLLFGAGPYVAYGVSSSEDVFDSNDDGGNFKRFDAGLALMTGMELKKNFQFTIGYDLGLVDMIDVDGWSAAKDYFDLSSVCNRNFKMSFVYFF